MSYFDQIIDKLFPSNKNSNLNASNPQPFVHETIERNSKEKAEYQEWLKDNSAQQTTTFIKLQYQQSHYKNENINLFRALHSESSNGFMLRYLTDIQIIEFQFLFDYLKDKTKELGYISYQSDRKIFDRKNNVETIERHYLKPSWRKLNLKENNSTGKMNQLYGNINIELFKIDNEPTHLKFMANNYNDSKFQEALPFNELLNHICS